MCVCKMPVTSTDMLNIQDSTAAKNLMWHAQMWWDTRRVVWSWVEWVREIQWYQEGDEMVLTDDLQKKGKTKSYECKVKVTARSLLFYTADSQPSRGHSFITFVFIQVPAMQYLLVPVFAFSCCSWDINKSQFVVLLKGLFRSFFFLFMHIKVQLRQIFCIYARFNIYQGLYYSWYGA